MQSENLASLVGTAGTVASTVQGRVTDLRRLVSQDGLRPSTLTEFFGRQ